MRFGATVRSLRHSLGISQETLAERAGLHRTYIAEVESGKRNVSLKSIEKLARALQVSIDSLFLPDGGQAGKMKFSSSEASNGKLTAAQPAAATGT
jgi:transcriptional regulator with XRE-family HTH domain